MPFEENSCARYYHEDIKWLARYEIQQLRSEIQRVIAVMSGDEIPDTPPLSDMAALSRAMEADTVPPENRHIFIEGLWMPLDSQEAADAFARATANRR